VSWRSCAVETVVCRRVRVLSKRSRTPAFVCIDAFAYDTAVDDRVRATSRQFYLRLGAE